MKRKMGLRLDYLPIIDDIRPFNDEAPREITYPSGTEKVLLEPNGPNRLPDIKKWYVPILESLRISQPAPIINILGEYGL
jgi:hypothetical protein